MASTPMLRPNEATQVFGQSCANCHTLTSQESNNKPLAGPKFWEGFTQKDRRRLADIRQNQHAERQRRLLAAATYNDLVALILKSNGFPAGTTDLGRKPWPTSKSFRRRVPVSCRRIRSSEWSAV